MVGKITLIVYGLLLLGGGIGGYASKRSVPSLVAGIVSAVLLALAFLLAGVRPAHGFMLGTGVAAVLAAFFVKRLRDTGKLMPSGGLLIFSLLVAGILGVVAQSVK